MEIEATYEYGVLKLDRPLPLPEQERVIVSVRPKTSRIRRSHGLIPWTGTPEDLAYLLGPDNQPWDE